MVRVTKSATVSFRSSTAKEFSFVVERFSVRASLAVRLPLSTVHQSWKLGFGATSAHI